ncbi:MAG: tetratricopeptide repeat protein [Gammaproteobacteria bacterium]|nr:MAG: tetratricopeptide repeat protein [Gammaproteobacteria bacterium]
MQFTLSFPAVTKSVRLGFVFPVFVLMLLTSCAPMDTRESRWDPLVTDGTASEIGLSRSIPAESSALASLLTQADTAIEQQQWPTALASLERAQRIDSKQPGIWTRLAVVYLAKQDPQQAIQMAKKSNSYARHDNDLLAYNWLLISRAYLQMNQLEQAKSATLQSQQYLQR